jgi:hypothetical protein
MQLVITYHPKARKLANGGYAAIVMTRKPNGTMAGSAVSQFGFMTETEARAHAIAAAYRAAKVVPFARVRV